MIIMKGIDFLFWHYYCFCERHKKVFHYDNPWQACLFLLGSFIFPIGLLLGIISTFITPLHLSSVSRFHALLVSLPILAPVILFLDSRYCKKKSIVKNSYQVFREKWGDCKNNTRKNKNIAMIYTIISYPVVLVLAIVLGELNRRGMFDGYQLFP